MQLCIEQLLNRIIIICFCLANIYWPGLGKVRFTIQRNFSGSIFVSTKINHSTQNCMHYNFDLNLFLKKDLKIFIKKLVKILNFIIIFYIFYFTTLCCEVFADVNAIYFNALQWIMNVCCGFETLKTRHLRKCFLI